MNPARDDDLRRILLSFRESATAAFAAIDRRFDDHDRRFDDHDRRLDALEGRMSGLEGAVRIQTEELRARMQMMETAILNSLGDFSRSVDARLTRVEERLDRVT